ncbi:MAG: ZIP family metal transporter [Acidimicrobiia bacterium]
MLEALGWGALAAASLLIGALVGLARRWPDRALGLVLAFGAGALISAISFDLALEGLRIGSARAVALGLAGGALTFFALDAVVMKRFGRSLKHRDPSQVGNAGPSLALGALLDGIPEQFVLGTGLAASGGVRIGLLVAIFVSNLPEAIASATEMHEQGFDRGRITRLWVVLTIVCTLSTVVGFAVADAGRGELTAAADGFAAGTLLVMLIDAMVPEAIRKAGRIAGLMTTLGFAVAAGLATVS